MVRRSLDFARDDILFWFCGWNSVGWRAADDRPYGFYEKSFVAVVGAVINRPRREHEPLRTGLRRIGKIVPPGGH